VCVFLRIFYIKDHTICKGRSFYFFHFNLDAFFKIFIYLRERERVRERAQEGVGSEGEADSLPSREPNEGLDPGTPGS